MGIDEIRLDERLSQEAQASATCVGLHAGRDAQVTKDDLGPWGRDYHKPLERMEADYGFRALPRLLLELCGRILASD